MFDSKVVWHLWATIESKCICNLQRLLNILNIEQSFHVNF